MEIIKPNAYENIIRAKVQLQSTLPFFSMLVMYLNIKERKDIPSCAVDDKGNLYYNAEWIENLTNPQVRGLLVHEVMHVVLKHISRLGGRDRQLFNIANDLVVNDMCVNSGLELPKDGIIPENHSFNFEDGLVIEHINLKTSEAIYNELYKHAKKHQINVSGFDEHMYGNGKDEIESKANIDKWSEALAQAYTYCKMRGTLPAGIELMIDELLGTKIDWRNKLYFYITNELPFDYTWSRPSRRSITTGIYLPSVMKEKIDVIVAVDTSGSIQGKELSQFLSSIVEIGNSFNNINVTVIVCDSEIHEVYELNHNTVDDILGLKISGGGGTSHKKVVSWLLDNKPNAKVLITLTDGYSDIQECYPELNCNKLIVLSTNSVDVSVLEPYGEVIKIEGVMD